MTSVQPGISTRFSVPIPARILEGGTALDARSLGAWLWSSEDDTAELNANCTLSSALPTVVFVPPLTGSADATSYWNLMIGRGRLFRPWAQRLLGFDLLGSPHDLGAPALPTGEQERPPQGALKRGALARDPANHPATVTPWDYARAIRDALDQLHIAHVSLVTGGSLGGMVTLCLAALLGKRLAAAAPIAAPLHGTAWILGWNHLGREAIFGAQDPVAGLALARQIARFSYRSEEGLDDRHGRDRAVPRHEIAETDPRTSPVFDGQTPYRVESYLAHAGARFVETWNTPAAVASYLAGLRAMDHHDLARLPSDAAPFDQWAPMHLIGIESDRLVPVAEITRLAQWLQDASVPTTVTTLPSLHGHDGFLLEGMALAPALRAALRQPRRT